MTTQKNFSFWCTWLVGVNALVMLFGLSMTLLPGPIQQFFGLALYGDTLKLFTFGAPALDYLTLLHGVLGAAMFGWGIALMSILLGLFRQGNMAGWWGLTLSILAWFISDTGFSLWTGFWQNALLNLGFLCLYALPLAATYRAFRTPAV